MPLTSTSTINDIAASLVSLTRMSVSSSGTGTITVNAAVQGFLTFEEAGCSTGAGGQQVIYGISDTNNAETASGVYYSSALHLIRGSSIVDLVSTNGNAPIDMSNSAQVYVLPFSQHFNQISGRNRIINGSFRVDQRNSGAALTLIAGGPIVYTLDRWSAFCNGNNVACQQVAGIGGYANAIQFTGVAGVTNIFCDQKIESVNCLDLVSKPVTFSVTMSNSFLTTVNWACYFANVVDNFTATTLIANGSFTVSATPTTYQATFNVGANAANGLELQFSVGAQTAGTWVISGVQLESGSIATPFEAVGYDEEFASCQRYYWKPLVGASSAGLVPLLFVGDVLVGNTFNAYGRFPVVMRTAPSVTTTDLGVTVNFTASSTADVITTNTDRVIAGRSATGNGRGAFGDSYIADAELT